MKFCEPLPHLFVHRCHSNLVVLSGGTIHKYLNDFARRAGLHVGGQPVAFTPHDFRRLFATGIPAPHRASAARSQEPGHHPGLRRDLPPRRHPGPPHLHHDPTQNPAQRGVPRTTSPPSGPSSKPHFVQRKVSLGTCGPGYGTSCNHEHACVRCGLLRADPAQADRFRDIIANLGDRTEEAEQHNWLGEVEGLKVSLAAAEDKLHQMERQLGQTGATDFGMPTLEPRAAAPAANLHATRQRREVRYDDPF